MPSAVFSAENRWSTRQMIRTVRHQILSQLLSYTSKGRRPWLQVIIDLTTLEKCGKFKNFQHLIHVLNGKRGLHLVVLYLVRDGKLEKRFVLSTRPLKGSTITWWGKRRWAIEGFSKTGKHRFGLHRFGQGSLLGVYRWLVLSLTAFILAHWAYLSTHPSQLPDWGASAHLALQTLLPEVVVSLLLLEVERTRPLLRAFGLNLQLTQVIT